MSKDDDHGTRCSNLDSADLDQKDIDTILYWHNTYRNTVASGEEQRGNPGPQRPAKYMMELLWDDELAFIARRWALQCNLFEKDQCRDVERFQVWQNVHVLDMNSVGNATSTARIHFHIQSWYDEVEDFDSAEFGFVNFTARSNLSYIAFASAIISQVGCGRAIYTAKQDGSPPGREETATVTGTMQLGFGDRVETLVCNYGPLDRKRPRELYEDGVPALCPQGTIRSSRYAALCQKSQKWPSRKLQRRTESSQKRTSQTMTSGTFLIKGTIYPVHLMLLLLARLWT
ncbi:venom allergen 3-like [Osmia lignaria lignaria]|uniref:venom allergen 3-like n=1 Tax=Osmia lignaria lignaria TaxID=1437193 RepID=UPI001478676D|nr:venom allergen 3-like [Osmia lignaria]